MKMLSMMLVLASSVAVAQEESAEGWSFFDGGWRISAGPVLNSSVKAKVGVRPSSLGSGSRVITQSQAEAARKAKGNTQGTRTTYPTGAWVDSSDSHEVHGTTWNVSLPAGIELDGDAFVVANEEYSEVVDLELGPAKDYHSDDSMMPGLNIELSRNLYHNDEWNCGVDLAFGVMYFFKTDILKADAAYNTSVSRSGRYETTIKAPDDVWDSWSRNADGTYGAGTYEGPGPVFDLGSLNTRHFENPSVYNSSSIRLRGDYRELELMLAARPYYDVAEWLRLYGTLGVVVSRGDFDLDMTIRNETSTIYRTHNYDEWDVYGVAGLGLMFSYDDYTLGCDFLARFLDDEISFNNKYVSGELERGNWLFRVTVGYEF